MTWIKLDDQFSTNQKILAATKDGRELYFSALGHCARNLTDGFIDAGLVRQLGALFEVYDVDPAIAKLLEVGLWDEAEGGYQIHDYLDYNPSKAATLALREARADSGRRGGLAKAEASAKQDASKDVASDVAKEKQNPAPFPFPFPFPILQQPAPEKRVPSLFYETLEKTGVLISQLQAEQYNDLIHDYGEPLMLACLLESAAQSARASPAYLGRIAARCKRDNCQPGEWANGKKPNDASASPPPLTPEEDAARVAAMLANSSLFEKVDQSRFDDKNSKQIIRTAPA